MAEDLRGWLYSKLYDYVDALMCDRELMRSMADPSRDAKLCYGMEDKGEFLARVTPIVAPFVEEILDKFLAIDPTSVRPYKLGTAVLDTAKETVNHPQHYGGDTVYEAVKVIENWELGFHLGNAVKYICRAGKKGSELEDLEKARWYLDRRIELLEKGRSE